MSPGMAVAEGLFLVFIVLVVSTSSHKCLHNNPSDELSFRGPPAGVAYVREGQYKMIYCCATGYTNLTWFKQFEDGFFEYPWFVGDDNVLEEQNNQSLRIFRARRIKDGGLYKCVARNDSHVIQHEVRLRVIDCEIKNGRIDITQKPTGPIMAGIGERREIICEGNFGCLSGDLFERIAAWRYKYKDDPTRWVFNNSRFSVNNYNKNNGTIVGIKLTIPYITADDYDTDFICVLQTPKYGSRTGFNVNFIPLETNRKLYWLFLLLVLIVVKVMCLILYCFYKERIDYCYRRSCCGKLPGKGDSDTDMLLLYSEADTNFVQDYFKPELNDYTIFDESRVLLGRFENVELQKKISKSYATVVIYTPAFLNDRKMCYNFDYAISAGAKIFLVQIKEIPKNSIPDYLRDSILIKTPSAFTSIKWPWKDPENSRKVTNFYCKLKKNLPRKQELNQRDYESTSSCRPLLSSASSYGNEDNVGSTGPEVRHARSQHTEIRVVTQTSQRSNTDSGIGRSSTSSFIVNNEYPSSFTVNNEYPDIPVDRIEIMV